VSFAPGDEVIVRVFGPGSPGKVVRICEDGDVIVERLGDDLPAWVPRIGRFKALHVFRPGTLGPFRLR
jgi:hypothetical protein